MIIGTDGSVQDVAVLEPAGKALDDAALAAVRRWKYKPFLRCGVPVVVDRVVTVNFQLRG